MLHWFFLSSYAFPFVFVSGGVGEYSDVVFWNRLTVNCSRDMFCSKIVLRGFGDEVIRFGIRNFGLLERGSSFETFSSESFSSEAWTTKAVDSGRTCSVIREFVQNLLFLAQMVVPPEHLPFHHHSVVAPLELDQGFEVKHLPFNYSLVDAPPESD
ncbi:hypothetical protein Tco_1132155 [Tanacetum coccineum]|uniref:Secreted protein n=1 Tax=Tanacetum coccineum TaxID=301880 RepID=A0ABQ5JB53_9ASTR